MCQAEKKDCMSIKCRFLQKQENKGCVHAKSVWHYDPPWTSTAQLPHSPSHFQRSTWFGMNAATRGSSTKVYLKSLQKIWMILEHFGIICHLLCFTFTICGVSDASDSKSGSSITNESICWATGVSGSVSESSARGVLPFFLPRYWGGCSAAGVKVNEIAASFWPLDSRTLDATFGFVMWITGLKQSYRKHITVKKDVSKYSYIFM